MTIDTSVSFNRDASFLLLELIRKLECQHLIIGSSNTVSKQFSYAFAMALKKKQSHFHSLSFCKATAKKPKKKMT